MRRSASLALFVGLLGSALPADAVTLSDPSGFATEMAVPTIINATVESSAPAAGLSNGTYCFSVAADDGVNGTTAGSPRTCATITGSVDDRQVRVNWTAVLGAVRYRVYFATGANPLDRYLTANAPETQFIFRSLSTSNFGPVPTTTTAYVIRISPQRTWLSPFHARFLGDGIRLYGGAARSPGFHIGGSVGGTDREGALGFALSDGHWAADAAAGDLILRVQGGAIRFANQPDAYPSRMTIGRDGVLYVTPANLDLPGYPRLSEMQFAVGWNVSHGRGEVDFFQHRGAGSMGGYWFYTQSNWGTSRLARLNTDGLYLEGALHEGSDARDKTNVQTISNALGVVRGLRGVRFNWKDTKLRDQRTHLGLLAQEVMKVVPEAVVTEAEKERGEESYAVHYTGLIPLLIEAVKEQQQTIDELKKRLLEVEARVNAATSEKR